MSTDNPEQDWGFGCFPLIAILAIALVGLFIYPILTSSPVDYFKLFWGVLFYLFFLFYFIRQARVLKTLPRRSATSSREDQVNQDQASAPPPEKPILHFYLFGARLKVFRYKFGKYSTYEIT